MDSSDLIINVAEICSATRALGPGLRAAIWVQGCPIGCKGCIAPDWIPDRPAHLLTAHSAAERLLENPAVEGITISGGEPMIQAPGLAAMLRIIRARAEVHVICFSGYRYEALQQWDSSRGVQALLSEIDVLIDGPYIDALNNGLTFAGSSNQRILTLSNRSQPDRNQWVARRMELHLRDRYLLAVGIPPKDWVREPHWPASPHQQPRPARRSI